MTRWKFLATSSRPSPFRTIQVPLDVIRQRDGEEDAVKMSRMVRTRVGFAVDRAALRRNFLTSISTNFEVWANASIQDWTALLS